MLETFISFCFSLLMLTNGLVIKPWNIKKTKNFNVSLIFQEKDWRKQKGKIFSKLLTLKNFFHFCLLGLAMKHLCYHSDRSWYYSLNHSYLFTSYHSRLTVRVKLPHCLKFNFKDDSCLCLLSALDCRGEGGSTSCPIQNFIKCRH